jgi:protein-disulfide isomerase
LKRLLLFAFFASSFTWAQQSDLNTRIEQNIRAHFKIPKRVAIEVGPRRSNASYGNYDQVTITLVSGSHRTPHEFLLSKDGNTLIQLAPIDITKNPFDASGRPSRGASATDAKVTILVYDDFQCPYCAQGHKMLMSEILPEYKQHVRVVYKDFPLAQIHPWAIRAAVDANCLFEQKNEAYWDYADYVHGNQSQIRGGEKEKSLEDQFARLDQAALSYGSKHALDMPRLQACVKAHDETAVRASMKYGDETLGVESTPTLFVNGERVEGAIPAGDLRHVLDAALREAGVPPPEHKPGAAAAERPTSKSESAGSSGGGKPASAHDPKN